MGNTVKKWDKHNSSIFEKFAAELEEYTDTQVLPPHGSQDVQFGLELQTERLKERNLSLKYNFIPRGHFPDGGPTGKSWSDNIYTNDMEWRTCKLTKTLARNGRPLYSKGKNEIFYETVTRVKDYRAVDEELYNCPNCGAIRKVKELREKCPYCGTFFDMSDLFPKITNYFCVEDYGGTEKEVKGDIFKFIIPCALPAIIIFSIIYLTQGSSPALALFQGVLGGGVFGAVLGYVIWAIIMVGGVFAGAAKSTGALVNSAGSRNRFESIMKKQSPEFSFEYFSNKVVSLMKMLTFAKNVQELPFYAGAPIGNMFENIVDSSYFGAVALKDCRVEGDYVYVTAEVYMENLYDMNGSIKKRNEKFRMQLYKRIDREINYNFSIKKIGCKSCGVSFDATKQRTCPKCGNRYEIGDDDWVVLKIVRS